MVKDAFLVAQKYKLLVKILNVFRRIQQYYVRFTSR